jgi:hypothetical protein
MQQGKKDEQTTVSDRVSLTLHMTLLNVLMNVFQQCSGLMFVADVEETICYFYHFLTLHSV